MARIDVRRIELAVQEPHRAGEDLRSASREDADFHDPPDVSAACHDRVGYIEGVAGGTLVLAAQRGIPFPADQVVDEGVPALEGRYPSRSGPDACPAKGVRHRRPAAGAAPSDRHGISA
ncbi:MAG: hypothetical protein INR65_00620 [Gluconacetobacter diazotrophicus]|nr:hypothetical protein [Gluconacetobacter diazotrophicus]